MLASTLRGGSVRTTAVEADAVVIGAVLAVFPARRIVAGLQIPLPHLGEILPIIVLSKNSSAIERPF